MIPPFSPASPRRVPNALLLLLALAACEGDLPTQVTTPEPMFDFVPSSVTGVFFSEYIEGSGNNKALEIYNGTGAPLDLGAEGYAVQMYFNGNTTAGQTFNLAGTVPAGDVFVLAHSGGDGAILAQADLATGAGLFNGDDAVLLVKNGEVVDAIGQVGFDPGSEWGTGLTSTADNTLRRLASVCAGDTNPDDPFDPAAEWDGYAQNTFDGLGSHTASCSTQNATEAFFSEYVEGSSNNKALEIYNGTGASVDLAGGAYAVQMYFNGNPAPGLTINLTGTITPGDVFVLAHSSADPAILAQADQTNGAGWFNGDDAVLLVKNGEVVDAIGQVGFDPGSEWGTGIVSTQDNTLRRLASVCAGDTNPNDPFDPSTEWDGYAQNTFDGLGSHSAACGGPDAAPSVVSTTPADGDTDVPLDADILVTFSEAVTLAPGAITLSCGGGDLPFTTSGGPTAFTLDPDASLPAGGSCTVTVSAAGVTDQDTNDPPDNLASDHTFGFTTLVPDVCGAPFTAAYLIQGSGAATPMAGQIVTTEGVVVGDYEGATPTLRGFYLQDVDGDGDAATSDAVFVFNGNDDDVNLGDVVRVRGTVSEYFDQTQIGSVTALSVCASGATVDPVDITLPRATPDDLEPFEGMLVRLPQTLAVTDNSLLGRFGQVALSSGGRLPQPTSVALPGTPALAVQAANDLNRILVDDPMNDQNPDPILFGSGGNPLSASNTLRGGDTVTGLVGVLTYTWAGNAASGNAYRVRPVGAMGGGVPDFQPSNPRPDAAPAVGGTLRVGSFNLLNFFNTFSGCTAGVGGASVSCRGASDVSEFERQAAKTVTTILELDADVLGLVELENDGYGPSSAIAELVERLNAVAGPGTWAFVDADGATGQVNALGTDAIKVGVIYKPGAVTPEGTTAVLNTAAFVNGGDASPRNRPSLAQAFADADGGRFVISVNHLKSKGGACDLPDAGDGQDECAAVRTAAAAELISWLEGDPTWTGDPDVIVVGDMNAYEREDPIAVFTSAGFTNLVEAYEGAGSYSYSFGGQWGSLDHALASAGFASQATGAASWHVNADEPSVLDYNTEFKSPAQQVSLYEATPFRSGDHDPLVVGMNLTPEVRFGFVGFRPPLAAAPAVNVEKAGRTVPVKFGLAADFGLEVMREGYPRSREVSCTTWEGVGEGDPTESPGKAGLTRNADGSQYLYQWKTSGAWSGQCRELIIRFSDGTDARARFQFR